MELKLYEIADQYREAVARLSDVDLPEEVVEHTLEALTGDLALKAINVAAVVLHMEGEAELIERAMQRMGQRRKALVNRAERLRGYLKAQMERTGIEEVKSPEFVLKIKLNPPKVILDDETAVPRKFKQIERIVHIDKQALRAVLLAGQAVPGAHLAQGTRLDIG
jgi:hypothetical protein